MKDPLVIRHGILQIEFGSEITEICFDHIDEPMHTREVGEDAIQWLIQAAIKMSKTAADLEKCMQAIREFYAHYLIDKSALNTLAWQLRNTAITPRLKAVAVGDYFKTKRGTYKMTRIEGHVIDEHGEKHDLSEIEIMGDQ